MLWTYVVNHSVIDISSVFCRNGSQATLMSLIIFKEIRKYLNQEHVLKNNAFKFFGQFKSSKKYSTFRS